MTETGGFAKWIDYGGAPVAVSAGSTVAGAGGPGERMYIVKTGVLEIRRGGLVLEVVGAGGLVGEMALVDDSPRSAEVVATTACELVPIDRAHFLFLVQETPTFALEVMRLFAHRLRRMNERLQLRARTAGP